MRIASSFSLVRTNRHHRFQAYRTEFEVPKRIIRSTVDLISFSFFAAAARAHACGMQSFAHAYAVIKSSTQTELHGNRNEWRCYAPKMPVRYSKTEACEPHAQQLAVNVAFLS
jgi:hypothetical protein